MTNNDYLELRERTLLGIAYIPYMFWLYNIIYEPIFGVWMLISGIYVSIAAIVMGIK